MPIKGRNTKPISIPKKSPQKNSQENKVKSTKENEKEDSKKRIIYAGGKVSKRPGMHRTIFQT